MRLLLFINIFLNTFSLSVTISHLSNYVDSNTLYCYGKTINKVNEKLKLDFKSVTTCFPEKRMLLNSGKAWVAKLKRLIFRLMVESSKIAKKKLFWVLLYTINSLFIITLKNSTKRCRIKFPLYEEFHLT